MKKTLITFALLAIISCKKEPLTEPTPNNSTNPVEQKDSKLFGSWQRDSIQTEEFAPGLYGEYIHVYNDSVVTLDSFGIKVISEWRTIQDTLFALYKHKYTVKNDVLILDGDESTFEGIEQRYKYFYHKIK